MYSIIKKVSLVFLLFVCFKINAQNNKELIAGTWIFDYEVSKMKMDTTAKAIYERMDFMSKDQLEKAYKHRKLVFGSDGTFNQQSSDGKKFNGSWIIDQSGRSIIITNEQNQILNLAIEQISSDSLVLEMKVQGDLKPVISKWYLIKK